MSHCLLTVTRGDRPVMLNHCISQVECLTEFDRHILISRVPIDNRPDLTDRIKEGYEIAKAKGFEWVLIVEDDDAYPADYVQRILPHMDKSDFIGSEFTFYYNIKTKTYERLLHPNHSSLFCTSFRVSAMDRFNWKLVHKLFLDIDIWRYARKNNFRRTFIDTGAVGIKGHGEGMAGGKGHTKKLANADPDSLWLKAHVDEQSFKFYTSF